MWLRATELTVLERNGGLKRVQHPNDPTFEVLVLVESDGIFAVRNECPHQGAPLTAGYRRDGSIECPLHSWRFRLSTGECMSHPWESIATYATRVTEAGVVEVELPDR